MAKPRLSFSHRFLLNAKAGRQKQSFRALGRDWRAGNLTEAGTGIDWSLGVASMASAAIVIGG
jgi:hypothetical protein